MTRRYLRTPLVEAVFEFAPFDANLDDVAVNRLDGLLQKEYAGPRDVIQPDLFIEYKDGKPVVGTLPESLIRHRRWNEEKTCLVQYSKELCAFNALKPYTHFEEYLPAMKRFFEIYASETNARTTLFLGQRYINRILLPSMNEPAAEYFTCYPKLEGYVEPYHRPFSMTIQIETLPGEKQGRVVQTLSFQGLEENRPIYILDLYAQTQNMPPIPFAWETVRQWQRDAHVPIEHAFNFALTPKGQAYLGLTEEEE